ncbi:MAG: POT family MFS transporter [Thermoguttaceae bacterium]|jgi:POT family proton-dependent oligopeptide transporter
MSKTTYLIAPIATDKMPPGVPYIIGNEAAERFCFYGMYTILVTFMTEQLMNLSGKLDPMSEEQAKGYFHLFVAGVYFFPIFGAVISDAFWGKYRTILYLSLVYCLGCLALTIDQTRLGLFIGLLLIALGSGGIKSCVSANVGDQFGPSNKNLLEKVFGWFYFSINFGSLFSTILTPILLKHYGGRVAFGVPGVLMITATFIFWLGRKKFVHIPPSGGQFVKSMFSREGLQVIVKLGVIFLVFVAMFWALYNQTASAWVLQAKSMDRRVLDFAWIKSFEQSMVNAGWNSFKGLSAWEIDKNQIQAVNALLILAFIPLFSYVVYPALNKAFRLTYLRKISIGMFITVLAFAASGLIEQAIQDKINTSIYWQLLPYILLSAAEVMVSITCLEFAYTQAPQKMKSLIMGLFLLSNAVGNGFTAAVNFFIENPDGTSKLPGASYYWFFTEAMLITAVLFVIVASFYREKSYIQDESIGKGETQ